MDKPTNRVTVNGTELAYIEQGVGEPLVLVHGSLNDFRTWSGQIAAFAEHYRVIALSRRYHWPNATPAPGDRYAIAEHADDLATFIETLGIAPARLVGDSYGALTVLTLAASRPGVARMLVLAEPPLFPWLRETEEGSDLFDAFIAGALEPAEKASERGEGEAMVRLFLDGVIGPGTFASIPPPGRDELLANAPTLAAELRSRQQGFFPELTCDEVSQIDVPVLLLDGEVSPRMFGVVQDMLVDCLPDVERETIPNASHSVHAGNPEAYIETVLEFLGRR